MVGRGPATPKRARFIFCRFLAIGRKKCHQKTIFFRIQTHETSFSTNDFEPSQNFSTKLNRIEEVLRHRQQLLRRLSITIRWKKSRNVVLLQPLQYVKPGKKKRLSVPNIHFGDDVVTTSTLSDLKPMAGFSEPKSKND